MPGGSAFDTKFASIHALNLELRFYHSSEVICWNIKRERNKFLAIENITWDVKLPNISSTALNLLTLFNFKKKANDNCTFSAVTKSTIHYLGKKTWAAVFLAAVDLIIRNLSYLWSYNLKLSSVRLSHTGYPLLYVSSYCYVEVSQVCLSSPTVKSIESSGTQNLLQNSIQFSEVPILGRMRERGLQSFGHFKEFIAYWWKQCKIREPLQHEGPRNHDEGPVFRNAGKVEKFSYFCHALCKIKIGKFFNTWKTSKKIQCSLGATEPSPVRAHFSLEVCGALVASAI